jgi:hypothetical protein
LIRPSIEMQRWPSMIWAEARSPLALDPVRGMSAH